MPHPSRAGKPVPTSTAPLRDGDPSTPQAAYAALKAALEHLEVAVTACVTKQRIAHPPRLDTHRLQGLEKACAAKDLALADAHATIARLRGVLEDVVVQLDGLMHAVRLAAGLEGDRK